MNIKESIASLEGELKVLEDKIPKTDVVAKMDAIKASIQGLRALDKINNPKEEEAKPRVSFNEADAVISVTSTSKGQEKVESLKNFILIKKSVSADWYPHRPIKEKCIRQEWMSVNYSITAFVGSVEVVSYKTGVRENFNHFIKALVREFPLVTSNVFEVTASDEVELLKQ